MVKLFNAAATKFRDVFGSGRSERNASSSLGVQSADKPSKRPLNKKSTVPEDRSLEYDDDDDDWVSEDESTEHGNNTVNPTLPSYNEATAALDNAVANDSHETCLCLHHQGCCRMHNSLRTPIRGHLDQPDDSSRMALEKPANPTMKGKAPNIEVSSARTLLPIHHVMSYHLSLDHLNCVRHKISRGTTKAAIIPELSCANSCASRAESYYDWLNDIYFDKGTFLQRQQMRCHISDQAKRSEYLAGCPHQSIRIYPPKFEYKNDMLEIRTKINNNPPRCPSHPMETWNSSQGRYAQIVTCTICHSDSECILEVNGPSLMIEYTCYRDLGPGTSSTHAKWLALIAGEGSPHRQKHDLKVYARLWNIGQDLSRSGLCEVTHQTPKGLFNAEIERQRRRGN